MSAAVIDDEAWIGWNRSPLKRSVMLLSMISKDEARRLALKEILERWNIEGDEPAILDEATIEKEFGWVFFYTSRGFLETQGFSFALAGNAPLIVNKFDSSVHHTGTALPTEYYVDEYEKKLGAKKQKKPEINREA